MQTERWSGKTSFIEEVVFMTDLKEEEICRKRQLGRKGYLTEQFSVHACGVRWYETTCAVCSGPAGEMAGNSFWIADWIAFLCSVAYIVVPSPGKSHSTEATICPSSGSVWFL